MMENGRRVHFLNMWCGNVVIEDLYPNLYLIVKDMDAFVYFYLEASEDGLFHSWNLIFMLFKTRNLNK